MPLGPAFGQRNSNSKAIRSYFRWSLLAVLILVGGLVRLVNLGTQFSHVDDQLVAVAILQKSDILDNGPRSHILNGFPLLEKILIVPHYTTYAPLQYTLTPFLISSQQTYRDILFWGRFPSFLFGCLSFVVLLFVYKKMQHEHPFAGGLLALSLLAFSWEAIIYSQQMSSYSIGVLASLVLFLVILGLEEQGELRLKPLLLFMAILALLTYAQYQILLFAPACFLALFFWSLGRKESPWKTVLKLTVGGGVYLCLLLPLLVFFLYGHLVHMRSLNWNVGPNAEFLFSVPQHSNFIDTVGHTVGFVFGSCFQVFQSNLSFGHPSTELNWLFGLLFVLSFVGLISLFRSDSGPKRFLGLFFALLLITWLGLALLKFIVLSPTRHTLILLPVTLITTTEGALSIARLFRGKTQAAATIVSGVLSLAVAVIFFSEFSDECSRRQDPFRAEEINKVIADNKVDVIICSGYTYNLLLMSLKDFKDFDLDSVEVFVRDTALAEAPRNVLFVDHRSGFDLEKFQRLAAVVKNAPDPRAALEPIENYQVSTIASTVSDTEIDYSNATHNGTNSYYLTLCKRKE